MNTIPTSEYPNARTVVFAPAATIALYLVGCGGTGSHLARSLAQIAIVLGARGQKVTLTFIDPDVIEERNVPRQMFAPSEIGQPKAVALATRYSLAWGLAIRAIPEAFARDMIAHDYATLAVVVGSVDNARARAAMSTVLDRRHGASSVWYLDCGNSSDAGQVLLGSAARRAGLRGAFHTPGVCLALPSPTLVMPDLLVARPEETSAQVSCADLVAANLQSLTINQRVAAEASSMLARFLVSGNLNRFGSFFDTASGTTKVLYASPRDVAAAACVPERSLVGSRRA